MSNFKTNRFSQINNDESSDESDSENIPKPNKFSYLNESSDDESNNDELNNDELNNDESNNDESTNYESKNNEATNIELIEKEDIEKQEIVEKIQNDKITKKKRLQLQKEKYDRKKDLQNTTKVTNLINYYSEKVEIVVNEKKLIEESDVVINSETKYCIIGNNGCGKTTLVKYVYEKIKNIHDVLLIDQDIEIESVGQTIKDFILDANYDLHEKYKQMKELEMLEELNEEQNELYAELGEYVYSNEWDKYEAESNKILDGLGFKNTDAPVNLLSGGWRMRLAIGKALLRKPQILFLDEPTNHLDLEAVIWLTDYLSYYNKTVLIITHQIGLVNTIADYTWFIGNPECTGTKLYTNKGGYNKCIQMLNQYEKEAQQRYDKYLKKVEEIKKKSLPKKDQQELLSKHKVTRPLPYNVVITFEDVLRINSNNIIEFKNVDFSFDNKTIFNNIEFGIGMDSRYIIVGSNGAGKTTLFKMCSGILQPTNGDIIRDERLRIGYYHQQIIENLPLEMTSIEYIKSIDSKLDEGQCRGRLGRIGLKKNETLDPCKTKIGSLSGGQKARIALCAIQLQNPHIILMDEPTNHLDIESIDGLIEGINKFNGGILIITHDTYLIESVNNCSIYEVNNNKISLFKGEFKDYCNKILVE
jgi:ATP-binding cassette subfamily F protein 1